MKITENFTLAEFERSAYAIRHGIRNTVPARYMHDVHRLHEQILQPLRDHYGIPVYILSGYRSWRVNYGVGGAWNSAHRFGRAADIWIDGVSPATLCKSIISLGLPFDKVILEFDSWTHVQVSKSLQKPRQLVYTATKENKWGFARTTYTSGIRTGVLA